MDDAPSTVIHHSAVNAFCDGADGTERSRQIRDDPIPSSQPSLKGIERHGGVNRRHLALRITLALNSQKPDVSGQHARKHLSLRAEVLERGTDRAVRICFGHPAAAVDCRHPRPAARNVTPARSDVWSSPANAPRLCPNAWRRRVTASTPVRVRLAAGRCPARSSGNRHRPLGRGAPDLVPMMLEVRAMLGPYPYMPPTTPRCRIVRKRAAFRLTSCGWAFRRRGCPPASFRCGS
jgi:hypothetical protein